MVRITTLWLASWVPLLAFGERINHEGRVLAAVPLVKSSLLFNTQEADAVVAAMQIMPRDNPWNEDVSKRPLLPNSDAMIARITADLAYPAAVS
jgi:hypothetical protein